jgi:hypothetical protein
MSGQRGGPPTPECGSAPELDADAAHVDVVPVGFTEAQSQQRESLPLGMPRARNRRPAAVNVEFVKGY